MRRDSGSIGSTGEGVPGSTAVGNRSDLPMGTLGGFGEFYPWLRELGEKINSKDEGILHDAYSQQSFFFFSPFSTVRSHVTENMRCGGEVALTRALVGQGTFENSRKYRSPQRDRRNNTQKQSAFVPRGIARPKKVKKLYSKIHLLRHIAPQPGPVFSGATFKPNPIQS